MLLYIWYSMLYYKQDCSYSLVSLLILLVREGQILRMAKKGQNILIKDKAFKSKKALTVNQAKRFATNDPKNCHSLIENWNLEDPLFVPYVELSSDNEKVINANVVLKGFLSSDPVQAGKLWDIEDAIGLKMKKIDLSLFVFNGSLQSELLDHSQIDYTFIRRRGGEEIDPVDIANLGFEGFSLRAYLIPNSSLTSKLLITIYPHPTDILIERYPEAENVKFPGISAGELDISMGIDVATILDEPVGSPIMPAIVPGSPFATVAIIPPASEIISRLATLLRTAIMPEIRSSKTALFNRFDSIAERGVDNLKNMSLEVSWPEPDAVNNASGK